MPSYIQHFAQMESPKARRRVRAGASLSGAAAAVVVWVVAGPLAGADLLVDSTVGSGRQHVGLGSVIVVSVLAGLAAWALLAVLERMTRHPRRDWRISAAIVLLVSLAGPAGAHADAGTIVALLGMHFAVAATLIVGLGRTIGPRQQVANPPPGVQPAAMTHG